MASVAPIPDILSSIAIGKYARYAKSMSELRSTFKNSVAALQSNLKVEAELDGFVRMAVDYFGQVESFKSAEKEERRWHESLFGRKMPQTALEFVRAAVDSSAYEIDMTASWSRGAYDIEARCVPWLVAKIGKRARNVDEISTVHIDLAFAESSQFLDAVFVGGMGCQRVLSPRPLRSKVSVHDILVNLSKAGTELTERLMDALRRANKEVLIAGWLGRFIIPQLKECAGRAVDIRIVTHRPEEAERTTGAGDKRDAFNELRQFMKPDSVRLLPSCHARVVVIDERLAFVGSMDLDSQGMAERDEAAVVSDDSEVVARTRGFFEGLFSKGTRPNWPE